MSSARALPPVDRLSALLERFRVRARLFHEGALCGLSSFEPEPGRGFLHVLRAGALEVLHARGSGAPARLRVEQPSLLFYPRPLAHRFATPAEGSDFVCAELAFEGGEAHPLVRALPPFLCLPLQRVDGLQDSLALLFRETEQVRCGHRLLADRLFEVVLLQLLRWLIDHGGIQVGLLAGLADPRLARALTAIHEQPGAAWNLERLAAAAELSRSAFAERFHRVTGQTPADYLARWRIALACRGLREGRPLGLLADELGYASHSSLSRVFRQIMGMSPRTWLQQSASDPTG
ncbi:AraC family transcriptional regulator [uncultured Aquimonas sp.]|uniref:AraC family transcriptional regulator n=1 Tax=uncultured Aquimonas sp. TaxID=385483 RepID=UPI00086C3EC4|nr:AraC family transcriptional regulator [uncultured Aquimonas sp.]ODU46202.1 MAG: AraC family transcriptional regulator [Xanthomonadaceae bacterium SCN 69-123]